MSEKVISELLAEKFAEWVADFADVIDVVKNRVYFWSNGTGYVLDLNVHTDLADQLASKHELWLFDPGPKKIQTIKNVRAVAGFSLKEAKDIVDHAHTHPTLIVSGLSEKQWDEQREIFEADGARVSGAGDPGLPVNPFERWTIQQSLHGYERELRI